MGRPLRGASCSSLLQAAVTHLQALGINPKFLRQAELQLGSRAVEQVLKEVFFDLRHHAQQ
eukprot:12766655-Prorocentrum_lima.AAC.1